MTEASTQRRGSARGACSSSKRATPRLAFPGVNFARIAPIGTSDTLGILGAGGDTIVTWVAGQPINPINGLCQGNPVDNNSFLDLIAAAPTRFSGNGSSLWFTNWTFLTPSGYYTETGFIQCTAGACNVGNCGPGDGMRRATIGVRNPVNTAIDADGYLLVYNAVSITTSEGVELGFGAGVVSEDEPNTSIFEETSTVVEAEDNLAPNYPSIAVTKPQLVGDQYRGRAVLAWINQAMDGDEVRIRSFDYCYPDPSTQ